MTGELIYIGDILSYSAFERFAESKGWDEWFKRWIEPQWLAWFVEVLKQSSDDPSLFPHGKWAVIQTLQGKLAVSATEDRLNIPAEIKINETR